MPGGDRTGPLGAGPLTGRGAGYCRGYDVPGFANPEYGGLGRGYGRGFGQGFGRGGGRGGYGRGRRNRFFATGVPGWAWARGITNPEDIEPPAQSMPRRVRQNELSALNQEAQRLRDALGDIERRIDQLSAADKNAEK